jgi:hypothetical protein
MGKASKRKQRLHKGTGVEKHPANDYGGQSPLYTKPAAVFIIILFIVSTGVYLNTLPNGFVYDDSIVVQENHRIKDIKYVPEILTTTRSVELANYYRPFPYLVYMFDYHIFGLNPRGFHLTSIILHGGVSIIVFLIAVFLLDKVKLRTSGSPKAFYILTPAFIASLLFAVHPINTETVAWVSGA